MPLFKRIKTRWTEDPSDPGDMAYVSTKTGMISVSDISVVAQFS